MFKSARIITMIGFTLMAFVSLLFPFDLKRKIIFFVFMLVLGAMSVGTTNILEYITSKFKKNGDN